MRCRYLLSGMFVLLAGCAHVGHVVLDPAQVSVTIVPDPARSGHVKGEVRLWLTLINNSDTKLRFWIDGESGPPFELSWLQYRIFKNSAVGFENDSDHMLSADGDVPMATLLVGSGDSTTLGAFMENVGEADCTKPFEIELEDARGKVLRSKPFSPCAMHEKQSRENGTTSGSYSDGT